MMAEQLRDSAYFPSESRELQDAVPRQIPILGHNPSLGVHQSDHYRIQAVPVIDYNSIPCNDIRDVSTPGPMATMGDPAMLSGHDNPQSASNDHPNLIIGSAISMHVLPYPEPSGCPDPARSTTTSMMHPVGMSSLSHQAASYADSHAGISHTNDFAKPMVTNTQLSVSHSDDGEEVGTTQNALMERVPGKTEKREPHVTSGIQNNACVETPMEEESSLGHQTEPRSEKPVLEGSSSATNSQDVQCSVGGPLLPEGLSYTQSGGGNSNDFGVVATKEFGQGSVFGPFKGHVKALDCHHNRHAWELCLGGRVAAYITPEFKEEWMSFVRFARLPSEWNIEAGQSYGRIYFTVRSRIEPGTELRVFYSDEYSQNCGFRFSLADLNYLTDLDRFQCTLCSVMNDNSMSMVRHVKFVHHTGAGQKDLTNDSQRPIPSVTDDGSGRGTERLLLSDRRPKQNRVVKESGSVGSENGQCVGNRQQALPAADPQRFICATCGKYFPSHGRLLIHESFHTANEEDDDEDDDDGGSIDDDGDGIDEDGNLDDENDVYDDDDRHGNLDDDDNVDAADDEQVYKDISLRCSMCNFIFHDSKKLARHIEKHKTHRFLCNECGNLYVRRAHMYRHKRECHGGVYLRHRNSANSPGSNASQTSPQAERISFLKFPKGMVRPKVIDRPKGDKKNRCKICNYVATCKPAFQNHLRMHRERNTPFGCEICGNVYGGKSPLYKHMWIRHNASGKQFRTSRKRESILKYLKEQALEATRCTKCGFSCPDQYALTSHVKNHQGAPFGCKRCGIVFKLEEELSQHIVEEHDEETPNSRGVLRREDARLDVDRSKQNVCPTCEFKSPDVQLMSEHIKMHRTHPCGCRFCGNTYTKNSSLMRHTREKHMGAVDDASGEEGAPHTGRPKEDACSRCGFSPPDQRMLTEHVAKHAKYPFGCGICGNVYTQNKLMLRHQREKHGAVRDTSRLDQRVKQPKVSQIAAGVELPEGLKIRGDTCPRCGFRPLDQRLLGNHVVLHLTHPFGCKICGNVYTKKIYTSIHMQEKHHADTRNTTGEEQHESRFQKPRSSLPSSLRMTGDPSICHVCNFHAPNERFLREHMSKHVTHPFGCKECGNVYTQNKYLNRHKKEKHSGAQGLYLDNLACPKCDFQCRSTQSLAEHKRRHLSAPYGCDVCGEVFTAVNLLMQHKEGEHQRAPEQGWSEASEESLTLAGSINFVNMRGADFGLMQDDYSDDEGEDDNGNEEEDDNGIEVEEVEEVYEEEEDEEEEGEVQLPHVQTLYV